MPKTLLIILSLLLVNSLFANNRVEYYSTRHITSDDGLPHNLVFDIKQSEDGFIWVATNNGLGRFDGYNFKIFRPQKNNPNSISNKSVYKLFIDNKNNLWASIQGIGVNKINLKSEKISHYLTNDTIDNTISGNLAISFLQSSDSNIWIGTNSGLNRYNYHYNNFSSFLHSDYKYNVKQLFEDKNKNIWIEANNDIFHYNTKNNQLKSIFDKTGNDIFKDAYINDLLLVNDTLLVIASNNKGLITYNTNTESIISHFEYLTGVNNLYVSECGDIYFMLHYDNSELFIIPNFTKGNDKYERLLTFDGSPINISIGKYCEDNNGCIWISVNNELYKINSDHTVSTIKSINQQGDFDKKIRTMLVDNMDNLWIYSERNGIFMIDINQKHFKTYTHKNNAIISDKNIILVFEDSKNNIWVGSYDKGVTCYNPTNNTYTNYEYITKFPYRAPAGICEDKNGIIWIGSYENKVVKIDPNNKSVKLLSSEYNSKYDGNSVRVIMVDNNNENIWINTNTKGIIEFDINTENFIYHSVMYENNYANNSHYRFLMQTNDGIIWTGTQNGGLGRYDKNTKKFVHYTHNELKEETISSNTVYYIHEQNDSILWIGTDKGLNKFNRNTKKFHHIEIDIANNMCSIYRIYPDNNNNLWMSGDCGLIKYNIETQQVIFYNKNDGLPTNQFNTTAGCKTSDGTIYLGTTNGLISFNPNNISSNPYNAKPVLTELRIFNKKVSPGEIIKGHIVIDKNINNTKKLVLPYFLNDFTLTFSALHFASPDKNTYEYKLDGYNSEWITTDANRRWANFTGLEPGDYTFQLRATNNDGILCNPENNVVLKITITPNFTKTWYFKLILIAILILIGYTLSRIRMQVIKNQKLNLEKLIQLRTRELESKNNLLEDRQEEITQQKDELEKHRSHLEELVSERTTELKKALEKAEESEKLKTSFLSNMSHEIRTPINAILGFSSILREGNFTTEEVIQFTEIIHNNAETLLNLLNDIIDISIIESGELKIHKKNINISELVNDVIPVFAKNNICLSNSDIKIVHHNINLTACTDPNRLKQILNNLIGNAIKFTKSGEIKVSYSLQGSEILFSIKDTGIGIEDEKLIFIFDRFNKIENINNELYRGGGLGLSISKKLSEALGGKIWAESKLGEGSTFHFTISQ